VHPNRGDIVFFSLIMCAVRPDFSPPQGASGLLASAEDRGLMMLEEFPATDGRAIRRSAKRFVWVGTGAIASRSITQRDQVGRRTYNLAFADFDRGPTRRLGETLQDRAAPHDADGRWKAHDAFRIESRSIMSFASDPESFLQAPDPIFIHLPNSV
jgi:hypothetical protein